MEDGNVRRSAGKGTRPADINKRGTSIAEELRENAIRVPEILEVVCKLSKNLFFFKSWKFYVSSDFQK